MNEDIKIAQSVFAIELDSVKKTMDSLNGTFNDIANMIYDTAGKVVWTGMGKSGCIARKLASTMSSLGTPSIFVHPAEALHGDLGIIEAHDTVIMVSNSGETDELIALFPSLKIIGCNLIAITGNSQSFIARNCDLAQILPQIDEACAMKLAPTSSTTSTLVLGDALSIVVSMKKGFSSEKFALFHPSGSLGKRLLLKVEDAMLTKDDSAVVKADSNLSEAISEMCLKTSRIISIVDDDNTLYGIITDGDIRRIISGEQLDLKKCVRYICTRNPMVIEKEALLVEALDIMKRRDISALPVVEEGSFVGTIGFKEIMRKGLI